MKLRPRTIQIYLPDGDPSSIRVAELTTSIVRVIEVPRIRLPEFLKMPEATQVGLYFLFGENESQQAMVYIGQSGNVGERLEMHHKKKDFWNKALVVVSLTNNFTQTHALYLEYSSIKAAMAADRYTLENGNAGSKPHTPAPLQADCDDIHETAHTLLATLGFPVFDAVSDKKQGHTVIELFYCTANGASGIGEYTAEGFVIHKGSLGRFLPTASFGLYNEELRRKLFAQKIIKKENDSILFLKDHLFNSPSMAGSVLLGRSSNGWIDWKDKSGNTLDKVKRSKPFSGSKDGD